MRTPGYAARNARSRFTQEALCGRVAELMDSRGWNAAELSEQSGVDKGQLSKFLRREANVGDFVLLLLARCLIPPGELREFLALGIDQNRPILREEGRSSTAVLANQAIVNADNLMAAGLWRRAIHYHDAIVSLLGKTSVDSVKAGLVTIQVYLNLGDVQTAAARMAKVEEYREVSDEGLKVSLFDPEAEITFRVLKARIAKYRGEEFETEQNLLTALELAKRFDERKWLTCAIEHELGLYHLRRAQASSRTNDRHNSLETAKEYLTAALEKDRANRMGNRIAYGYLRLSDCAVVESNTKLSLDLIAKGRTYADDWVKMHLDVAEALIHVDIDNMDQARRLIRQPLRRWSALPYPRGVGRCLVVAGLVQQSVGNVRDAVTYLLAASCLRRTGWSGEEIRIVERVEGEFTKRRSATVRRDVKTITEQGQMRSGPFKHISRIATVTDEDVEVALKVLPEP